MQAVQAINHIGIAVSSIEAHRPFCEDVLGATYEGEEIVADQKVKVGFFKVGAPGSEVRLELLEPTDPDSTVAKFIEKKGEGLHHVAYTVDDIEQRLRDEDEKLGKATIYRTLDLLVRSKLVEEHDFGEGFKRYEHRLARQPVHEHLICLECGTVIEFQSSDVQKIEAEVTAEHGCKPARHKREIYGLCRSCREAGAELPYQGLTCPIETV